MGSKSAILVLAEAKPGEKLQEVSARGQNVSKLFAEKLLGRVAPSVRLLPLDLAVWPDFGAVCAASIPGIDIVCSRELLRRNPSELTELVGELAPGREGYAVFMDSAEDWAAFAVWSKGTLMRSLSISPESGVDEDLGKKLSFETPFWGASRPVRESVDYPLPFHPIDLGNEALRDFFGFILEGREGDDCFDPEETEIWEFRALN